MNISSYLSFLRRYLKVIAVISILLAILSGIFTRIFVPVKSVVTVFLSLGIEQEKDLLSRESIDYVDIIDAADKFGETIKGWFRNPGFLAIINRDTGNLFSVASVKKQALQNLVIVLYSRSVPESILELQSNKVYSLIEEEIHKYNQKTKSSFVIATYYISYSASFPPYVLNIIVGFLIGLFLTIVSVYLYELFKGVISFDFQIKKLLKVKTFFLYRTNNGLDFQRITSFLSNFKTLRIFASVSRPLPEDISVLIQEIASKMRGDTVYLDVFSSEKAVELSSVIDYSNVIISTTLPEHSEIYRFKDATLILLIKSGFTKIDHLKQIRALFEGRIIAITNY